MKGHLAAACAVLLAAGCIHSQQRGKAEVKDATSVQSGESEARARKVTPKTPPGHPPLAASPGELLEPGSQRKIAEALKSKGVVESADLKGDALTAGIRKFQKGQGLAETGFPDHETLLRLGIDPKEVDKSLENFSGSHPGQAQADVGKREPQSGSARSAGHEASDRETSGEQGSGTGGSGKSSPPSETHRGGSGHETPPSDTEKGNPAG